MKWEQDCGMPLKHGKMTGSLTWALFDKQKMLAMKTSELNYKYWTLKTENLILNLIILIDN